MTDPIALQNLINVLRMTMLELKSMPDLKGWVTINGNHVLIGEEGDEGDGGDNSEGNGSNGITVSDAGGSVIISGEANWDSYKELFESISGPQEKVRRCPSIGGQKRHN